MKVQMVLLVCIVVALSSVQGQKQDWSGQKCGIDNQQLYDRSLKLDTCNDYCRSSYYNWHKGKCEINNGYGECRCYFCVFPPGQMVVSTMRCE